MAISPERQARLVQLAYLVLPPKTGRHHRARVAHAEVEQVLAGADRAAEGRSPEALYELLRGRVIGRALAGGASRGLRASIGGGGDGAGTARDEALARLTPPARAAYALRHLEGLTAVQVVAALAALGVPDPATAVKLAEQHGPAPACLKTLDIPATGILRRRKAVAAVAVVALAAPGLLLLGGGSGSEGATEPTSVEQVQENTAAAVATKKRPGPATTAAQRSKAAGDRAGAKAGSGTSGTVKRTAVTRPDAPAPGPALAAPDAGTTPATTAAQAAKAAPAKGAPTKNTAAKGAAKKAAAAAAKKRAAAARQAAADPALDDGAVPVGTPADGGDPAPADAAQDPAPTQAPAADETGGVPADPTASGSPDQSAPVVPEARVA